MQSDTIIMLASGESSTFTAKQINKQIQAVKTGESRREWLTYLFGYFARGNQRNRTFQFWQSDNHPIELWSPRVIEQKLAYIHWNPVTAKIVSEPSHYIYSSASNYFMDKGILDVKVIPSLSEIGYIQPLLAQQLQQPKNCWLGLVVRHLYIARLWRV